ncbi:MAG: thioesterase [Gammaproteobacteria bacterium]|nr:thioesterase [Gammaproteobacteria bacterium]
MLSQKQLKFTGDFLSPFKQKLYYLKSLPMGLVSGIKLIQLDEEKSVSEVPFRWCNKNPFNSMYFAVQSMAAELSTAAPVMLALKGSDADIALIIVDLKADFAKKAQSKITFTCMEYDKIYNAVTQLKQADDTATVNVKTIGRDIDGNEVATFYFTWSFKRRP